MVPRIWYTSIEMRRGTVEWEILAISFTQTFDFTSEHLIINVVLQIIKENIFEVISVGAMNFHQCTTIVDN